MAKLKVAGSCWEAEQRMIRAEEQAKVAAVINHRLRTALATLLAEVDGGPDYGQSGPDTPGQAAARAALLGD